MLPLSNATDWQKHILEDTWGWLYRDPMKALCGQPWAVWHVEHFGKAIHIQALGTLSNGRHLLGLAANDGQILLSPSLFAYHPAIVASVALHESVHLRWAAQHGSAINSRAEELNCLTEQRDFLVRLGQDPSWLNSEFERL